GVLPLGGDRRRAGREGGGARAAEGGQAHDRDRDRGGVDAEVGGRAGGDARQHPVLEGTAEGSACRVVAERRLGAAVRLLVGGGVFLVQGVCVHGSRLAPGGGPAHR